MRVSDDGRDPPVPAASHLDQPVGHVLVAVVQQNPGHAGELRPHRLEHRAGRLARLRDLLFDQARRYEQADDAPDHEEDPLAEGEGAHESHDRLADRVVDQEDGDLPLPG